MVSQIEQRMDAARLAWLAHSICDNNTDGALLKKLRGAVEAAERECFGLMRDVEDVQRGI